jgi:Protein of unknown function (DUF3829)
MSFLSHHRRLTVPVAAATAALALMLGACKGKAKEGGAAPSADQAAGAAEQQLTGKINILVACLNNMNPAIHSSRDRYFGWADREKGPSPKGDGAGQGINAVIRESTYGYECFKKDGGLDAALTAPPKLEEIDKAAVAYKAALDAVIDTTKKADAYYSHGDYKDDHMAQGLALHAPLVAAFAAFDHASHDLSAALDKLQDELAVKDLAKLEKTEGKKAHWQQQNLMRASELMLRAITAEREVDVAKIAPAVDAFTKAFDEAKAWTEQNKADADKIVSWGTLMTDADQLATAVKELHRGVRDKHKVPESGDGSVEQIISRFNSLVEMSNNLWH